MQIFYYNEHADVDFKELAQCFQELKEDEKGKLRVGDQVWLDLEPYHPYGKVYGFSLVTITKREEHDEFIAYEYESEESKGRISTRIGSFFKVVDRQKIDEFVSKYGQLVTSPTPVGHGEKKQKEKKKVELDYSDLPDFLP